MSAVAKVEVAATGTQELPKFLVDQLNLLLKGCDDFLKAQRNEIILGQPTSEKAAQHRTALKWMVRMMRAVHAQASDPKFPDREFVRMLEGRVMQLEEYWAMFGEPVMGEDEADKILRSAFPE